MSKNNFSVGCAMVFGGFTSDDSASFVALLSCEEVVPVSSAATVDERNAHLFFGLEVPSVEVTSARSGDAFLHAHV